MRETRTMKLKYLLAASVAGVAATCVVLPAPAIAQQITTGIDGTVSDESGNPVAGATVVVIDTRTGTTRTITTDGDGNFTANNLVTGGPYTVTVSADGFEGQSLPDVMTTLQGYTSLGFTLTSGGGEIVVTGAQVRVTQLAVGPGTSFTAEVLEAAPTFNRDVRDVIRIDPRVSLDRDDTGSGQDRVSCLGGNDRGNAFTVDGTSQGDIYGLNDTGFASRSSTPIPYDAVRETQVQFAPFDVDYGQFTGCAINVVTKSGTNEYHFGGFFEYSDDGLRGNTVNGITVAPVKPDKRWGGYIGGPVIKDRLWLFGAYEHQEAGQSQDEGPAGAGFPLEITPVTEAQFNEITDAIRSIYGVDSGPLVFSRPFKNDRYFVRGDLQITDGHRLEATYQRLEESVLRSDDQARTGTFRGTVVGQNTFYLSGTESNYYSGRLYSDWTDNFSTELRYSRSEVQDLQDPFGGGEAQSGNPIPRIFVGVANGPGTADDGVVEVGPGFSRSANDLKTNVDQYRAVARWELGDHSLKLGGEINRADLFNLFVQNATSTLIFRSLADLQAGLLSPGTGNNDTTNTATGVVNGTVEGAFGNFSSTGDINDAAAEFTRTIYSAFLQDDWQVTDQFSATLGLRVDWYKGGHPELNENFLARYGFENTTGFSDLPATWMPRAGFTYDLDDFAVFGRAQLRGGVGIFSGGDPLVWFGNAFQNDGRGFAQGTTQDAPCPAGQIDVVDGSGFTGVPTCFQQAGINRAAAALGDTQSIDPDIKSPSVVRANLGFASELNFTDSGFFSGWNLGLDYIYSHYRNPYTIVDLSMVPSIAIGLNGFSIDGRPIYRAIDPTAANCDAVLTGLDPVPTYSGVTAACFSTSRDDELMLTNSGSYDSHIASIVLSKNFNGGVFTDGGSTFFSFGYAYTDAHDRRNMYNSTAGSNYDNTAAFDRQNPAESTGFFASKHNFSVSTVFTEQFADGLDTKLGITFIARSGRPYSITFGGTGIYGDSSSGSDNALFYVPTGLDDPNVSPSSTISLDPTNPNGFQALLDWIEENDCVSKYAGQSIPRNTCEGDWYYDMDLSFSQELPGPGRLFGYEEDRIKLFATMDNFLNLLDDNWNVQRRRDFAGRQDVVAGSGTGVDAQGRYIYGAFNGATSIAGDNAINFSSSVWRLKVGISYDF
jgi:outer membrane receptor protein involved in Fe transport